MSAKIPIWTFADMSIDDIAKFLNDHAMQPGTFGLVPLPENGNTVRVVYLAAEI